MKLVYIGGPFSAPTRRQVEENIRRVELTGIEVARLGACPWMPHANTQHPMFEHIQPYEFWIRATLKQLSVCDVLLLIAGWERSSGARGERAEAIRLGIPIVYSLAELEAWLIEDNQWSTIVVEGKQ